MKHENLKSQHVMPLGFFLYSLTFIQTGKLSIFQEEIAFAVTAWGVGEALFQDNVVHFHQCFHQRQV